MMELGTALVSPACFLAVSMCDKITDNAAIARKPSKF